VPPSSFHCLSFSSASSLRVGARLASSQRAWGRADLLSDVPFCLQFCRERAPDSFL